MPRAEAVGSPGRRDRRCSALTVVVVAAALVGGTAGISACSDPGRTAVSADRGTTRQKRPIPKATSKRSTALRTTSSAQPSTSTDRPQQRATGPEITIAFAGDNNGEGLPEAGMANAMADRLSGMKQFLSSPDLTVANLETAITSRGEGAHKAFTFRAPPSILTGLQTAGIDAVSMANNHGLDFGLDGLEDSLEAKQSSPIPIVGIGVNDADAFAPAQFTVKGLKVAVIGATQVLDSSLITAWTATASRGGLASAKRVDRLVDEVKKAVQSNDIVIVFLHWGTEKNDCPNPAQQQLARTLAAAGTTLIVGGHAHRVQGGGFLGRTLVDYGLGNFGFHASSPAAAHTGVLTVTLQGSTVKGYAWHPGIIQNSRPEPLAGSAAEREVATWNQLRSCTGLTDEPT